MSKYFERYMSEPQVDTLKLGMTINLSKWKTMRYIAFADTVIMIPVLMLFYYIFGTTWVFWLLLVLQLLSELSLAYKVSYYEKKLDNCLLALNNVDISRGS